MAQERVNLKTLSQEDIARLYAPLVKRVAQHLMSRLPASVEIDDLIQVGLMALIECASHFDDTQGAMFETYAAQRVRGSMLDELRSVDIMPRQVRQNLRRVERTIASLEQQLGHAPDEALIAQTLDMDLGGYQKLLGEAHGFQLLYLEDFDGDEERDFLESHRVGGQMGPSELLESKSFYENLVGAIEQLPEREKMVMSLYYEQDLNLKEIGQVLGVTESRVCQIHTQAVSRLRSNLHSWVPEQHPSAKERKTRKKPSVADQ